MSSVKAANLFDVKGLVAVVTGGGTGIGLMLAKVLEENGAKVYIVGRRMDVLEKASNGHHGNIIPLQGDVSKKEDLLKIVDFITKTDGFINALIVNHGILGPDLNDINPDQTLLEMQEVLWKANVDDFTNTYRVNTSAVYFSTIAFLGLLEAGNKQGNVVQKSQVIATASIGGLGRVARPGIAYVTSKAAVIHLMKVFATTFANHDIRSNVIAPGLYPSETTEKKIIPNFAPDGVFPRALIPLQRLGSIEDMAGAILYLTSQAGAFVNGNVIVTDGGSLSILPSSY